MSMSLLKGILEEQNGEDITKLRRVVLKLENHLKQTNAGLGSLRQQLRNEFHPKLRKVFLQQTHTMVWEQQTIIKILRDYKKKLGDGDTSKEDEKKQHQVPTRNDKLIELLRTNDVETEKEANRDENAESVICLDEEEEEIKSADDIEASESSPECSGRKRKMSEDLLDIAEDNKPKQIHRDTCDKEDATVIAISSQDEALKYLAALQEYAMLNDNFRATGLLIQVEKVIKNPPSTTDFEL